MGKNKTSIQMQAGGSIFLFIISSILVFIAVLVVLSILFYNFPKIANKVAPPSSYTTLSDTETASYMSQKNEIITNGIEINIKSLNN